MLTYLEPTLIYYPIIAQISGAGFQRVKFLITIFMHHEA